MEDGQLMKTDHNVSNYHGRKDEKYSTLPLFRFPIKQYKSNTVVSLLVNIPDNKAISKH